MWFTGGHLRNRFCCCLSFILPNCFRKLAKMALENFFSKTGCTQCKSRKRWYGGSKRLRPPECYLAFPSMRNSLGMRLSSLIPRPVQEIGKKGLMSTIVHVLNFPTFWEFWILLLSIATPGLRIFNRTLLTIASSMRGLESAVFYAFVRHWGKTTTLKQTQKQSVYPGCLWVLANKVIYSLHNLCCDDHPV